MLRNEPVRDHQRRLRSLLRVSRGTPRGSGGVPTHHSAFGLLSHTRLRTRVVAAEPLPCGSKPRGGQLRRVAGGGGLGGAAAADWGPRWGLTLAPGPHGGAATAAKGETTSQETFDAMVVASRGSHWQPRRGCPPPLCAD